MNPDPNGQPVSSAQPLGEPVVQPVAPEQAMEQVSTPTQQNIEVTVESSPMVATSTSDSQATPVNEVQAEAAVQPEAAQNGATSVGTVATEATTQPEPPQPTQETPAVTVPAVEVPTQPTEAVQPIAASVGLTTVKKGGKGKLFLLIGAGIFAVGFLALIVGFFVMKKSEVIGSLTSDSYVGINFKRPSNWIRVGTTSTEMYYHPKTASGKSSNGTDLYSLSMVLNANKNVVGSIPSAMSASKREAYMDIIDTAVSQASKEILPNKATVGCTTDPTYKDKPKKLEMPKAFMAITYSFTCAGANNTKSQSVYYVAVDIIPNDKDIEYLGAVAAATPAIYEKNKTKINEIIASFSL